MNSNKGTALLSYANGMLNNKFIIKIKRTEIQFFRSFSFGGVRFHNIRDVSKTQREASPQI